MTSNREGGDVMSGDRAGIRTALGALLKTLIICLTAVVSLGCAHRAEHRQYPGVADYDAQFLKSMLDHQSDGIEMSAKCASNATHAELKQLCTRMLEEQKSEQKRLKQYSCEWFQKCQ